MAKSKNTLVPVLLGGDLNAYSVARSFYESYNTVSHAFLRYRCGATDRSKFIKTHISSGIDNEGVAVPELLRFAKKHSGARLMLIPCTDSYTKLVSSARKKLEAIYNIQIPDKELVDRLSDKESFLVQMKERGIKIPRSIFIKSPFELSALDKMEYPAVIKPADSSEYWRHPFTDMKKVYFPKSDNEAKKIAEQIYSSGYTAGIVAEEYIAPPARESVLTTFSDNRGTVVRAVLGDVILAERGKSSYGNYSAIVTVPLDRLSFELIDFLGEIGYRGFANFDIMSNGREKYVLEINTRQGRSCDYMRAAGVSIAELLVENMYHGSVKADFSYSQAYWHYPPHRDVVKFARKSDSLKLAKRLRAKGEDYTPYGFVKEGAKRKLYELLHSVRLSKELRKNEKELRRKKECKG